MTRTQANGSVERNVRVLRSIPGGLPFMLSYPDTSTDPGLEAWKEDEELIRDTVFDSLCLRWTYSQRPVSTATSPHGPRDTWDAIFAWYSSHQTIDTMPSLPFTITAAKGANFTVSGIPSTGQQCGRHSNNSTPPVINQLPPVNASSTILPSIIIPWSRLISGCHKEISCNIDVHTLVTPKS